MSYPLRQIAQFASVRSGYAFKSADWQSNGVAVVKIGNIKEGSIVLDGCSYVSEETADSAHEYRLHFGDVLITMSGIIGEVGRVRTHQPLLLNQRVGRFVLHRPGELSLDYLFYCLRAPSTRTNIEAVAYGAAQPNVRPTLIGQTEVAVPPRRVQDRIANILAAYDDLIENSTKRITLLEQQTALMFGHVEADARSAAKRRDLGEIADEAGGTIRTGPFGSQLHESDYTTEGTPVVMPKNLREGRIDTSDIARIPKDIVERLAHHKLSEGDIVYGRRGDIGRRAFIRQRQAGWLCGTGCLRITLPGGPLRSRYLHQYLGKPEIVSLIASRAVGATMPNLNTSILRGIPIDVPPLRLQDEFVRIADANDELVDVLAAKNENLRKQRDLLLPRLLSGEIDVSRLPMPDEGGG
ncbi:restriction endonuclease subunit S [Polyangium jinanense]|uniref:Restriction endonuclease subunit S n=1 Tax=Polyangium jinanense TaxID=2829994 RepID=A0A9X4B0C9_9BACT|nr:restriction endonuclease subunit S [Polyangium jinanense]MDC3989345.1 restriction endonuclease subunit S [Polyangium jinanense]